MAYFFAATSITNIDSNSVQKAHLDPARTLSVGDVCMAIVGKEQYIYCIDASGDAVISPKCLLPNGESGNLRWKLTVINTSGITLDGNLTVTGTVDGRNLLTDGTKLDGIESGANVNEAQVNLLSNPFGAMSQGTMVNQHSPNLITEWGNISFDTLNTAGSTIISAVEAGDTAIASTNHFSVTASKRYTLTITCTNVSGNYPYLYVSHANGDGWKYAQALTSSQTFSFVEPTGGDNCFVRVDAWGGPSENSNITFSFIEDKASIYDDCSSDNTVDWGVTGTLVHDTDHYELSYSTTNAQIYRSADSLINGRVYTLSMDLKDGTAFGATCVLRYSDGVSWHESPDITTTGSWVKHTFTFKANDLGVTYVSLKVLSNLINNDIEVRNVTLYEQTRACLGANTKCFDGWSKDATLGVYRGVSSDYFEHSSEYSCCISVPSKKDDYVLVPFDYAEEPKYSAFAGRTVVIQARAVSSTANDLFIAIYNNLSGITASGYHSGGGTEEVLEVSATIPAGATQVYFYWMHSCTIPGVAKITDFQISFGAHIGVDNYTPPPPHYVPFVQTSGVGSTIFTGASPAETIYLIDASLDSALAIPANASIVSSWGWMRDSGSGSATSCYVEYQIGSTAGRTSEIWNIPGVPNDTLYYQTANHLPLDGGVFRVVLGATGVGTLDLSLHYSGCYFN